MTLETRIKIETQMARATVKALLTAGFAVAVDNGGDSYEVGPTTNQSAIFSALGHTDEERLFAYTPDKAHLGYVGWVFLVYGNDGYDLINDYTTNLEQAMEPVNALADKLEEKHG